MNNDEREAARRMNVLAIKAELQAGLADIAAGRVQIFDVARIIDRGRKLWAARTPR